MCRNKRFSFKTISVHLVFSAHWIPDNTHIHTHMLPSPHTHVSCRNINEGGGLPFLIKRTYFKNLEMNIARKEQYLHEEILSKTMKQDLNK